MSIRKSINIWHELTLLLISVYLKATQNAWDCSIIEKFQVILKNKVFLLHEWVEIAPTIIKPVLAY